MNGRGHVKSSEAAYHSDFLEPLIDFPVVSTDLDIAFHSLIVHPFSGRSFVAKMKGKIPES